MKTDNMLKSVEEFELDDRDTDIEDNGEKAKVAWSSRFEYVLSMIGHSIGLGDIWRLPYLVYRNGGGAFLIPYACCMLFCGIPLFYLEMALSQFSGSGTWRIWNICPLLQGIGFSFIAINWMLTTYLSILRAWIIEYLISSFQSDLPWDDCNNWWNTKNCYQADVRENTLANMTNITNISGTNITETGNYTAILNGAKKISPTEEFWEHKILQMSSGLEDFGDMNWMYVLYLFITHVIIFIALAKSVSSIGKLMYITVLAPCLLTLVVWIRALTIKGAVEGMLYFIKPDFSHLGKPEVWIEAAFMSLYTLGPGWGSVHTLSSHADFKGNCLRDAVIVVVSTLCYGIINGLVVFSVIGVMSAETGVAVNEVLQTGGFSLGFVAYPRAVVYFPFPQVWAAVFFIILLLPSVDVATVSSEPVMCALEEALPPSIAKRRVLLLSIVMVSSFLFAVPFASGAGVYLFQFVDWYTGTLVIMFICIVEAIVFSWVYGLDRVSRDIYLMIGRPLPHLVRICLAFIIPIAFVTLFIISMYTYKPPTLGDYQYPDYTSGIGWCISMSTVLMAVVYMIVKVIRMEGSLRKRLSILLHFNDEWRPADPDYVEIFEKSEKQHESSFKNLFWFNLTGRTDWQYNTSTETEKLQRFDTK